MRTVLYDVTQRLSISLIVADTLVRNGVLE
jgi:hypothetical protein